MQLKSKNTLKFILKAIGIIIIIIFGIIIGLLCLLPVILSNISSSSNKADGFTIEDYKVYLDVLEDNKVNVTEDITVYWYSTNHHGLYKFIPEWLEYTDKNNKIHKRKAVIKDLKSNSESYSTDFENGKAIIKLGNPNSFVDYGLKTYNISYLYDMGKDPYIGFDEFIFHVFGDYWGTTIKNASLEVKMPKSIEGLNINFFTDKYRKNNINGMVDYQVKDDTIYVNVKNNLSSSLTVDVELPNDYFHGGSYTYGFGSLFFLGLIFALTFYTYLKWKKYGKDYQKHPKTVEFYPPDNLNAAQIGYIYGAPTRKLVIGLIIELASKGYLKINDRGTDIEIINLLPKPIEFKTTDLVNKRIIQIKKIKDYDESLSKNAKIMMKYLFKDGDFKNLSANIDIFLKVKDELVQNHFIEIISDEEKTIDIAKKANEEYLQKKSEYENILKEYASYKNNLKPLSKMEQIIYDKLFEDDDIIILSKHKTLYQAFDSISLLLKNEMKKSIKDSKAFDKIVNSILICILNFILLIFCYFVIKDMDPNLTFLYFFGLVCCFITVFLTIFMDRKPEYGEAIEPRVDSFREYLLLVEKDQLENMVSKNPTYFYDILPYTYVLGISKKWISKFENIQMPKIDMGTFDYNSDAAYSSFVGNIYYPISTGGHSSNTGSSTSGFSRGGGSSGGGCSSCGGGGSW